VGEAGPIALAIQLPGHMGHMVPAPGEGHHSAQQAQVVEMGPMKAGAPSENKLVERRGHAYQATHGGHAPQPRLSGRYRPSLAVGRELPRLPRLVKPQPLPCLKSQSTGAI